MVMSFFRKARIGSRSHRPPDDLDARRRPPLVRPGVDGDPQRRRPGSDRCRHRGDRRSHQQGRTSAPLRTGRARLGARRRRHRSRARLHAAAQEDRADRRPGQEHLRPRRRRRVAGRAPTTSTSSSPAARRSPDVRRSGRPARLAGRRRRQAVPGPLDARSTTPVAPRCASTCTPNEPGSWAVPRAMLYRYWKRIVANLAGIVTAAIEPIQNIDYLDDGATDIDDD